MESLVVNLPNGFIDEREGANHKGLAIKRAGRVSLQLLKIWADTALRNEFIMFDSNDRRRIKVGDQQYVRRKYGR
jgi:hypothetical protein